MFMCRPEKNKKQSTAAILIFVLAAIACAFLWMLAPAYKWIFQLLFFLTVAYIIYYLTRYSMTQWIYKVESGTLIIIKQQGAKEVTVCSLDLSESLLLIDEISFRQGKDKDKYNGIIHKQFNYAQNISACCYYYVFKFQEKNYLVKFEPNEVFVKMLNDEIANLKK